MSASTTSLNQRLLLTCFICSVLCSGKQQITQPFCSALGMLRPRFVLFGDSLTQKACDPDGGWAAGLAHKYQRKARPTPLLYIPCAQNCKRELVQVDIISRGYSGYNTRWAAYLLESMFPAPSAQVRLATLFWGANDAALPSRHRQARPIAPACTAKA